MLRTLQLTTTIPDWRRWRRRRLMAGARMRWLVCWGWVRTCCWRWTCPCRRRPFPSFWLGRPHFARRRPIYSSPTFSFCSPHSHHYYYYYYQHHHHHYYYPQQHQYHHQFGSQPQQHRQHCAAAAADDFGGVDGGGEVDDYYCCCFVGRLLQWSECRYSGRHDSYCYGCGYYY